VTRAIVLDVEGTTTPIAFVRDVLFPFARERLAGWLARGDRDAVIAALAAEHAGDPDHPPAFAPETYVRWLMDRDRKSTALKALQGAIWRAGYESGELRAPVYDDVPPALTAWRAAGIAVAIYSSGSIEAQQLLFRHSTHGDLTPSIDRYFDTTTGAKRDVASYRAIAAALGTPPAEIAFVSDVGEELVACRAAGLVGILAIRPGNAPVAPAIAAGFPAIASFAEIHTS
jgi:enolase-phosphatase E1